MQLTPEQLATIEKKQLANIVVKLQAGKTLTKREQDILDRSKNAASNNFVAAWAELADELGVSRRWLQEIRNRFKKAKDLPTDQRDGRKDVTAWRKFFVDRNLWSTDASSAVDGQQEPTKADWDRRRAQVDFEAAQFRLQIEKRKYVQLEEILAGVGQMLVGFRTAINMLPGSAARWLIGLKDFHAIKERLQSEVDGVLQSLGRGDFLDDVVVSTAKKLFPDEKPANRQKLCKLAQQVLIEIGRKSLTDLLQRDFNEASAATE